MKTNFTEEQKSAIINMFRVFASDSFIETEDSLGKSISSYIGEIENINDFVEAMIGYADELVFGEGQESVLLCDDVLCCSFGLQHRKCDGIDCWCGDGMHVEENGHDGTYIFKDNRNTVYGIRYAHELDRIINFCKNR